MSNPAPALAYWVLGANDLEVIRPLWEKLRAHHSPLLSGFPGAMPPFDFAPRKNEILAKVAADKIRIELVSQSSNLADIAYCVSTISADGRGEVDSMFVEESFRGRGIGSELVRRALAWMDGMGTSSKFVTVAHANEAALEFYQRLGFLPRTVLLQQNDGKAR